MAITSSGLTGPQDVQNHFESGGKPGAVTSSGGRPVETTGSLTHTIGASLVPIVRMLLVAMPGAPDRSVLAPSSDALCS